ncbi:MAG TPA: cyclic pyranopterin monophosphate synthase MoaC [Holophagaceae bacterium]|nr:cyclic pyranopterin monophosphate synthase MoaC [Holophagaceae bacterium]
MAELTHLDPEGRPRMVDVGDKAPTVRRAVALGYLEVDEVAAEALGAYAHHPGAGTLKKGDPWSVARIGAVNGAKRTADLIPLCHPLALDAVSVDHAWDPATRRAWFKVEVRVTGKTGVEMEALAGVTGGLLTLYDMLKAVSHRMSLGPVRLLLKEGGRRGTVTWPWEDAPWGV